MSDRATRLAEKLPEIGADLLVVTSLVNVRYLTGFTGSSGMALVGPDTRAFITDFRYLEQSAAEVDGAFDRTIAPQDLMDAVPELLGSGDLRLAVEDAHMSVRTQRASARAARRPRRARRRRGRRRVAARGQGLR